MFFGINIDPMSWDKFREIFRFDVQKSPTVAGGGAGDYFVKEGVILMLYEKEILLLVGSIEYCDTV